MSDIKQASPEILDFLRRTDTCAVSNAIETFNIRMRNEGYIQDDLKCMFPEMPPFAGYAVTGRIRTVAPPISGLYYYQNVDWWRFLADIPGPKVVVLADMDHDPGVGAFFGEVHAQIARALGCVAYVSNGAVRDLPALKAMGFQCVAGGLSPSHAYGHIVEFGEPVEIGCLRIRTGDLLQGDRHGVQSIPLAIADQLPNAVSAMIAREAELIRLCRSPDFSIEKLAEILKPT